MEREQIVEHAAAIGSDVLGPGLASLAASHPVVGEVRGMGVFWALELVTDRASKEPLAPYGASSPAMDELAAACRSRGLLPFTNYNRLHVVPPCTVSEEEAERASPSSTRRWRSPTATTREPELRSEPGPELRQAWSSTVVDAQQAGRRSPSAAPGRS